MATSVTSPLTAAAFTGVSKFASSLQQVLTRAVGIASLPLDSLNAGLTTLTSKQTALQGLDTSFSSLQVAIGSLQTALSSGTLSASVSDGSVLAAAVQPGAAAGVYTVQVGDFGSYSTSLGAAGSVPVTDVTTQGISSDTSYTLGVGSASTTITAASSSLQDLDSAINAQAGDQVQATLVNVGSAGSPDYRLALRSLNLGTDGITLTDASGDDLTGTAAAGTLASYQVNGSGSITSTTRAITLAPGLTATLLSQSTGTPTTITVQNDASSLASAFSSFATAYNAAGTALTAQHGASGGALQGDSVLDTLQSTLSQLGTYSNGDPSTALANFGITLDENGVLSVDTAAFTTAANANFSGLLSTLGDSETGGFLQTATSLLSAVEDPVSGALPSEESSVAAEITAQNTRIASEQATVNQLQTSLTAQIAQADATIASLESQVSYVTGLFATYTGADNTQSNGLSTL